MIILLLISLILLSSCAPSYDIEERTVYLFSVADDFSSKDNQEKLENVINDQAALVSQFQASNKDIEMHIYSSENGKRYYSTSPKFEAYNSKNTSVSRDSSDFDHFGIALEKEANWTMDSVIKKLGELECAEDDLIIFIYSGHGDENGSLITNNKNKNNYDTTARWALVDALSSLRCNKILILDSCYSGSFIEENNFSSTLSFSSGEEKYKGEDEWSAIKNSSFNKKIASEKRDKLWIMSSTTRSQVAADSGIGEETNKDKFGAFTYYLLLALGYDMEKNQATNVKTSLTFYEVYNYIWKNFNEKENQTPRAESKILDIRIR